MDREAWLAGIGKLYPKVPESDTLSQHMTVHYEKLLVNTHRLNFETLTTTYMAGVEETWWQLFSSELQTIQKNLHKRHRSTWIFISPHHEKIICHSHALQVLVSSFFCNSKHASS